MSNTKSQELYFLCLIIEYCIELLIQYYIPEPILTYLYGIPNNQ